MGETVVLYSLAAILSACVAALGFKISDKSKGGISITKMAEDLAKSAVPGFKVILGTAAMALDPGTFYAYMQVVNGKTSVPQNLISWIQNWLSENGAYDTSGGEVVTPSDGTAWNGTQSSFEQCIQILNKYSNVNSGMIYDSSYFNKLITNASIVFNPEYVYQFVVDYTNNAKRYFIYKYPKKYTYNGAQYTLDNSYYRKTSSRIGDGFPTPVYYIKYNPDGNVVIPVEFWQNGYGVSGDNYVHDNIRYDRSNISIFTTLYGYVYSSSIWSVNLSTATTIAGVSDSGLEAGENVPGKDVVIPGEGTGTLTNEDIVGWLQSAVGAAVASALGIGTATIPFVPVAVKNPAITGDITDALDNVIDQVQDIAQAGATDIDTVATGDKYANISLAPSKPSGNISASSLYTIWNPSQAQLNNIARFLWSTDFVDTIKKILQSPMDAIISLALFPVTPPTDGTHNISLGYIDSGVSARRVSDQFMTVQTSGLVVPHKYNSYLDYAPYTSAEIFLPFIGFCPLNINDIMGKSVDVTYNIDLLSGVCTAIVHANAQSLYSYSGNMAMFLPLSAGNWARMLTPIFGMVGGVASLSTGISGVMGGAPLLASTSMAVHGAESIGNLGGNSVSRSGGISGNAGIMGDYQPFIVVTRPINDKPTTYDSNIGQTYNKSAQLGTLSGFTVIEEAHIEGMNATDAEKQEIERLLKEGVIL